MAATDNVGSCVYVSCDFVILKKQALHKVAQTALVSYSQTTLSVTHCNQMSVKIHCISLIGLYVCLENLHFGKNTAHNHHEQSHKLSQVYMKGTFILCTFVELLVSLFLLCCKHLFSVSDVVHSQLSKEGVLGTVA